MSDYTPKHLEYGGSIEFLTSFKLELYIEIGLRRHDRWPETLLYNPYVFHLSPPHLRDGLRALYLLLCASNLDRTQPQDCQSFQLFKLIVLHLDRASTEMAVIDPFLYTNQIYLEEEAKNKVQPQRCFNPTLKEVLKKEVLKLKDTGIIYPVSHSTWVSPTHVVPMKFGMTIVENSQDGKCIKVFMDDFTVYGNNFDSCLKSL
ncbi:Transposon Ty3-I Gag-Pol polyprotein [Cucumis melo var. makuwa]|uniref:Transposon Ty3-I Gag-Pol polyprotein n=1 Tax=Cucumis melo var. makuwa TaxID=1194695 RepID=A0A5A7VAK1_CUCMM|nr:Transposon Ty3-I Gag-Pol polyprotein [Cucumis melo var. makuwa]TYK20596.1 Transposon Ty3-I Gag-Pol polyprotein [Cucumis melo var. makuwa]